MWALPPLFSSARTIIFRPNLSPLYHGYLYNKMMAWNCLFKKENHICCCISSPGGFLVNYSRYKPGGSWQHWRSVHTHTHTVSVHCTASGWRRLSSAASTSSLDFSSSSWASSRLPPTFHGILILLLNGFEKGIWRRSVVSSNID